tara:strand:+ start:337 stop:1164 length:828 start_codon:yes stop_codon:yes gene_type:complete
MDAKLVTLTHLRKSIICDFPEDAPWIMQPNFFGLQIEDGVGTQGATGTFTREALASFQEIKFEIKKPSRFTATLGFNSLLSAYTFKLVRATGEGLEAVGESKFVAGNDHSSQINLYSTLSTPLANAGSYIVNISRSEHKLSIYNNVKEECEPFSWAAQVFYDSLSAPFVYNVQPSSELSLQPGTQYQINIDFSTDIYNIDGARASEEVVRDALQLSEANSNHTVSPLYAVGSGRYWAIIFAGEDLRRYRILAIVILLTVVVVVVVVVVIVAVVVM